MKKLLFLVFTMLFMFSLVCFSACGNSETTEPEETNTYNITFVQSGKDNVVKQVKSGENLVDIPSPANKVGYNVVWDTSDFTNITQDIIVNAIETPKNYTITFNLDGGVLDYTSKTVTYDQNFELDEPSKEGYTFKEWSLDGNPFVKSDKWDIDDNITLKAEWDVIVITITFKQTGKDDIVKYVNYGETLLDIPDAVPDDVHTYKWNVTNFTLLKSNLTVNAVVDGTFYTVTYNFGTLDEDPYIVIENRTSRVLFGSEFTLSDCSCFGYNFLGWKVGDSDNVVQPSSYTLPSENDISFTAIWEFDEGSDRWGPWTPLN